MHFRVVSLKRGKSIYRYAQIVERYYENGKAKNRVIKHLGPVRTDKDIDKYRKIFAMEKRKESIEKVDLRTLDILPPKEFGLIYAAEILSHETGLDRVFEILDEHSKIIFFSVISRLIEPSSDLGILRLLKKIEYPPLAELKNKDMVYSALDKLISKKDEIEEVIVKTLRPDMRSVYYDLTSTYFEGKEKNDVVLFGYSRDKKREKKQIVVGIVMADDLPIHHDVFPGNTVDSSTLSKTVKDLRSKFYVKRVTLVGDRAFGRKKSFIFLDKSEYITAVYRWDQPYRRILMNTEFTEESYIKDQEIYAKEVQVYWNLEGLNKSETKRTKKRRAIVVYNSEREKEDLSDIEEKIFAVKSIMARGKKGKELIKALGNLRSYVNAYGTELNIKKIDTMKKLAGRFMIVTNTDLAVSEAVKQYKNLWRIERLFRTIKSLIEIRPVYHSRDDRIESHVFVCVLSLLFSRLFEKSVNDEMTISVISEMLSELKAIPVRTAEGIITLRSESENARIILDKMKIPYPGRIINSTLTVSNKK